MGGARGAKTLPRRDMESTRRVTDGFSLGDRPPGLSPVQPGWRRGARRLDAVVFVAPVRGGVRAGARYPRLGCAASPRAAPPPRARDRHLRQRLRGLAV